MPAFHRCHAHWAQSLVPSWVNVILLCLHSPDDHKAIKTGTVVPPGDASQGSASQNSTSTVLAGESLVGVHVERLGVEVVDGVAVYVAGAQYSVHKLKEHLGKNLCWLVVVSNKKGNYALTVCPCKGQAGHEPDGHNVMHQVDKDKKAGFTRNAGAFRLRKGDMGCWEGTWWQAENAKP